MARRDPNWSPTDAIGKSMRDATMSRLRALPGKLGTTAADMASDMMKPKPAPAAAPGPAPEYNQPAGNVPSPMDLPDDPRSGIAGVFSGRNGLRAVSRAQADAAKTEDTLAPIDTSDTTDYAGITRGARQGIRSATMGARRDATRSINPMSNEAELLRRAGHETGSYFNKGFPGARNAKVEALLGQLEAGNEASATGAEQEGAAELNSAGAQMQSGLDDRNARNTAALGLRGSGKGGDMGDMIALMQLDETRRANTARETEGSRGRVQERVDSLFGDPTENPNALDKTNSTDRLTANFIALSEEDPNFIESEEGQQLGRRLFNELTAEIDQNKSLFSPRTGASPQVSGRPTGLRNVRVDPEDDVGWRNFVPDYVQEMFGGTPGSLRYRTPSGDEAAAPLDNVGMSPLKMQMIQELSARFAAEEE